MTHDKYFIRDFTILLTGVALCVLAVYINVVLFIAGLWLIGYSTAKMQEDCKFKQFSKRTRKKK